MSLVRLSSRIVLIVALAATFSASLVTAHSAAAAQVSQAGPDCDIRWAEVLHDTFNSRYRSVRGATTPGTTVRLRLRVAQADITGARVRVWDDRVNQETYYPMSPDLAVDRDPVTYDWWSATIPVGDHPTILYYFFEIIDEGSACSPADQDFYVDDDPGFYGGGLGAMSDVFDDRRSFQITVYDPAFAVPSWMQRAVIYQIFPDRFRNGDETNDPPAGRFFYAEPEGTIVRSGQAIWNATVCDPRDTYTPSCSGKYGSNFYGGDLEGIIEKIEEGYFDNLGVSALYLNPIFSSPSNHKYDTADFMMVDPDFGDLADFQELARVAEEHGIRLILDGVFNHVSSDSRYFDRYCRYDAEGNPAANAEACALANDGSGACESTTSPYRDWFYFSDSASVHNPGLDSDRPALCEVINEDASPPETRYEAWYGYSSLPKLQANASPVRDLIWAQGIASAGPYWTAQGASGWRFDVGGDVDPGLAGDPDNDYWEGFRAAVRAEDAEAVTLGEEWSDASSWLLGHEWDSAMNYRLRSALLSWLFTGCSGNGCSGGARFEDNDSNSGSSSGPISYISPSQFNARLLAIQEDYPTPAWKAMMNLAGSHDTNRLRFLLKKINRDNDAVAVQRMKEWWLFAFTYAGAPTLYYGDEVGLSHDGVWANDKYEDDPYNRAPFPWDDTPGSYVPDTDNLLAFARHMASIRQSYRALQDGDVQHGLIIDDVLQLYGFARTGHGQTALVALNHDGARHIARFSGLNAAPYNLLDGTTLVDALHGNTYTVAGGSVAVPVNPTWGVVLLEKAGIETPAAPEVSYASDTRSLSWQAVTEDAAGEREVVTAYRVYGGAESGFQSGPSNLVATVAPPAFGSEDNRIQYTLNDLTSHRYYQVCASNAADNSACAEVRVD